MHPNFRMIVLANRPGFPFLGNDFFREAGDCFSVHVIQNPPRSTMLDMLRAYAPDESRVPQHVLTRLVGAFQELHELYVDETLAYPYSVRELVNVVNHIHNYPLHLHKSFY